MAKFSKKYYNPLYFILNDLLKNKSIRGIFAYGGKSSSKTVSIAQVLSKECYVKGSNVIAYRKESAIIQTTLKKSFELAINSQYLYPAFEGQLMRFLCENEQGEGSEIVMKGLDKEEKAKGIESYKYLYLDELNHFTLQEYEQFNLSLRGIEGQKILASWNPVDENSWVKTDLVDKFEWVDTEYKLPSENSFVKISTCGRYILIKTNYEDNYWITGSPCGTYGYRDDNLIAEYEALRTKNYNSYRVNVQGEWGKVDYGGEFLKSWRSEKHVDICQYNPKLALYLIFDENVVPYFPCGFYQVGENQKDIRMVHHLSLKNPDNTVSAMCNEINKRLRLWGHTGEVYVGGDATSQKEDVKQEKGMDLFRLIMNGIKEYKPTRRVMTSNPSVRVSKDFVNEILSDELYGINVRVDKSCRIPIVDFENTKEDKNGAVDKTLVRDPITKKTYQPYGHHVDIFRYMCCATFASDYLKYQRGGNIPKPTLGKTTVSRQSY